MCITIPFDQWGEQTRRCTTFKVLSSRSLPEASSTMLQIFNVPCDRISSEARFTHFPSMHEPNYAPLWILQSMRPSVPVYQAKPDARRKMVKWRGNRCVEKQQGQVQTYEATRQTGKVISAQTSLCSMVIEDSNSLTSPSGSRLGFVARVVFFFFLVCFSSHFAQGSVTSCTN
jgi:hypothetical protein